MKVKVFALALALLGLTSWCAFHFVTSPKWDASLGWWTATMIFLINFWAVGVHWIIRYFALAISFSALVQQFSNHITTSHLYIGLVAIALTFLLCRYQYAAEALWSTKTIVIDWLVCTVLIIVAACIDVLMGKQYLILALSYFCSSNILSVVVMKSCEKIMTWRSPQGSPRVKYIHNLAIPSPAIPSLHTPELLTITWTLAFILAGKAEYFLSLPNGGDVAKWQLLAASGFFGSLFTYMCPLIADKNPAPYYTPQELASKRQQS
jgi:hypothetical protein